MTSRRVHYLVLAITTVLAIAAGLWQVVPPAPPRSPAPHEFDLDRATAHVRAIAKEPHPNGFRANAAVREYLLDQLRALGLDPQIQTRQVRRRWDDSIRTVHNIVARIPASKSTGTGALLLTAHYDSSANAPGAGDDAAGVAAILETLRALKVANHPPARDLIILLSDGEELGLLGAKAFCGDPLGDPSIPSGTTQPRPVKEDVGRVHSGAWPPHPWLKDISMVLGFEARGAAGPSIMFEASPGNLNLIRHFAKAAPHPVASSLSYEVYKLIRNDTDFTIFRRAGLRGLNFAFIADQLHYHRRTDTPENLSPRSLFHHGTYALALTRHFSENPEQPEHRDAVWFNPWRGVLAYYPATWVWPLSAVQLLLAATALFAALRQRAVTGRGLLGATLRLLLSLALAAAFVFTMQRLLAPAPVVKRPWHFEALAALFSAIAAAVAAATMLPWLRRTRPADLIALAIIVWMLLSILASVFAPGATYLTLWPTLPTIALLFVVTRYPDRRALHTALAALAVAIPLLLFTPTFYLGYVALGLQSAWPIAIAVSLAAWLVVPAFALNHPPPAASAPPAEAPPPSIRTP